MDLPKTEQELQTLIDDAVSKATATLTAQHNDAMAKERIKYDKKLDDFKKSMELSEEERAKKLAEEQAKAITDELNDLRAYKKGTELANRLEKEGLPKYFVNDNRLLNASDNDLDKAIKVVKGEYEATLPKGNQHSTVVNMGGGDNQPNKKDDKGLEEAAKIFEDLLTK